MRKIMSNDDHSDNCPDKLRPVEVNSNDLPFKVHTKECVKSSADLFLHANKISLPSLGVSFSSIPPSFRFNVFRADRDVNFCHGPKLQNLSQASSKLQSVKQDFDYLSSVNTVLKITLQLKNLEKIMVSIHLSLDHIMPLCIGVQTVTEAMKKFKTFSVSLIDRLNECSSSIKQLFVLQEVLESNKKHCEKMKTKLRQFNCMLFKSLYCKHVAIHLKHLVEKILFLQVFFELPRNNENDFHFISPIIFDCNSLLRSVEKLSLKLQNHSSNSDKVCEKSRLIKSFLFNSFLFIEPVLPVDTNIVDEYSLFSYIKELAERRSALTVKRICSCIQDTLGKKVSVPDMTQDVTAKDTQLNAEFKTNIALQLKSKKVAKLLRKDYCNVVADEKDYFHRICNEISAIGRDSSFQNGEHVSTLENKKYNTPLKIVDWDSEKGPAFIELITKLYTEHLWDRVNYHMKNSYLTFLMSFNDENSFLNNSYLYKMHSDILCSCINKLIKDAIPTGSVQALSTLLLTSTSFHNIQQWDNGFCKAMGAMLKEKFRYSNENTGIPSSHTVKLLLRNQLAQANIQNYFNFVFQKEIIEYNNTKYSFVTFHGSMCLPLNIFLSYLTSSLYRKRQQFLISGNWEQFFVVTSVDVEIIHNFLDHIGDAIEENFNNKSEQLNVLVKHLSNKCRQLKTFEEHGLKLFLRAVRCRSRNCLATHMPMGKVWRRRGYNVTLHEANSYVNVVANLIFLPLLDNLNCLSKKHRNEIIQNCIEIFIRAWMEFILDEQMMFSFHGANQLRVDFEHFLCWFEQDQFCHIEFRTVKQPLDALKDMRDAIMLLMCQPHAKKSTRYEETRESMSTISEASVDFFVGDQFDQAVQDIDLHDKERWLALRVKTNQRKFLCLSLT